LRNLRPDNDVGHLRRLAIHRARRIVTVRAAPKVAGSPTEIPRARLPGGARAVRAGCDLARREQPVGDAGRISGGVNPDGPWSPILYLLPHSEPAPPPRRVLTDRSAGTTFPLGNGMPAKNDDLHGNVPDQCPVALILIDVINDMEFGAGEALLKNALPAARALAKLKRRAKDAGVPVIYVNDNFGKWRSDFRQQLGHVLEDGVRGEPIAKLLRPDEQDYFVLKAKHSGFYHTQLDLLIDYLRVKTVVLAGFATDMCVLFTASDAYLRDLNIIVPPDCSASASTEDHEDALQHMSRVLHVRTTSSSDIDFRKLVESSFEDEHGAVTSDEQDVA